MPEPTDLISMKIFKDSTNSGLGKWVQLPRGRWQPSSWHEVAPFSSLCLVNCICIWSFINLHLSICVNCIWSFFATDRWTTCLHTLASVGSATLFHRSSGFHYIWLNSSWSVIFICSSGFQCGWCTSVRTSSRLHYENLPKIHVDDRVFKSVRILTHLICLPRFDMYLYITSCQSRPCVKETTLKTSYKHLYIYSGSLICHLCCYDFLGQKGCWAIDKSCISWQT